MGSSTRFVAIFVGGALLAGTSWGQGLPQGTPPDPSGALQGLQFGPPGTDCQQERDQAFRNTILNASADFATSATRDVGNAAGWWGNTGPGSGGDLGIGSAFGNAAALTMGMNAPCPDAPDVSDDLSCSQLELDGKFNPGALYAIRKNVEMALLSVTCKKAKLAAIQVELSCTQQVMKGLQAQLNGMNEPLAQQMNAMGGIVTQYQTTVADYQAKQQDVDQILHGNSTGAPSLLDAQKRVEDLVDSMPARINELKQKQAAIAQSRQAMAETIQNMTMAGAAKCFATKKNPNFHCTKNGPAVTAEEYVLCRYEQNQHVHGDGSISNSQVTTARASAGENDLKTLLDNMFGQMPDTVSFPDPSNPQEVDSELSQNRGILTVADLDAQYGDSLSGYDGHGLHIHDFIVKQMGSCFASAKKKVEGEQTSATSKIGVFKAKLKTQEDGVRTEINSQIDQYAKEYQKGLLALTRQGTDATGRAAPIIVDTSHCENASPDIQASCLDQAKDQIQGLLSGSSAASAMTMTIKGTQSPQTDMNFKCQGINNCVTQLQNMSTGFTHHISLLNVNKQKYITAANQAVDSWVARSANALTGYSSNVNDSIKNINLALSSLGISGGVDIKGIDGESLSPNDKLDGLYGPPKSTYNLIGSKVQPPLPDLNGDPFGKSLDSISDGIKKEDEEYGKITATESKLASKANECAKRQVKKDVEDLNRSIADLGTKNCAMLDDWCSNGGQLDNLKSSLGDLDSTTGADASDLDAITTTGTDLCNKTTRASDDLDQQKDDTKDTDQAAVDAKQKECTQDDTDLASTKVAAKTRLQEHQQELYDSCKHGDHSDTCGDAPKDVTDSQVEAEADVRQAEKTLTTCQADVQTLTAKIDSDVKKLDKDNKKKLNEYADNETYCEQVYEKAKGKIEALKDDSKGIGSSSAGIAR